MPSSLDELEKKLYKKDDEAKPKEKPPPEIKGPQFAEFEAESIKASEKLTTEVPPFPESKKILWKFMLAAAVILILGAGVIFIYQRYFSAQGVIINIEAPNEIMAGEKFDLKITYQNDSAVVLKNAKISLELPEDAVYLDSATMKRIVEAPLEDIGKEGRGQNIFPLAIFGDPKTVKHFKAYFFYEPSNFNRRISKIAEKEISISGPIVSVDISLPKESLNKVPFGGEMTLRNNSNIPQKNILLKISYPLEFDFIEANPAPFSKNDLWEIKELSPSETRKITFRGSISGKERNIYKFELKSAAAYGGNDFIISRKDGIVSISPSLIPLSISVNHLTPQLSENYISKLDDDLIYKIEYQNKTNIGLKDVIIKAKLEGQMIDFSTINTSGYFDFKDNAVSFHSYNIPALGVIKPNEKKSVEIKFKTKKEYPGRSAQDKNFFIKIAAEIQTKSVPPYVDAPELKSSAEITTKIKGQAVVECKALFYDAASNIINKGPMPFKAGQTTNLTIRWKIKNYSTNAKDISVKSGLPEGIQWTGVVKTLNTEFQPSYDERTKIIKWEISKLPALSGILDAAPEAIFQIAATPSIYGAGKSLILFGETDLKAKDEFTDSDLNWQCWQIKNYDLPLQDPKVKDGSVLP